GQVTAPSYRHQCHTGKVMCRTDEVDGESRTVQRREPAALWGGGPSTHRRATVTAAHRLPGRPPPRRLDPGAVAPPPRPRTRRPAHGGRRRVDPAGRHGQPVAW